MKLIEKCSTCGKTLVLTNEFPIDDCKSLRFYKCGHYDYHEKVIWHQYPLELTSFDGTKKARPYQVDGIDFIYKTEVSALLTDQVGLGKTATAAFVYRNARAKLGKCLIVVKSATVWQWNIQWKQWADNRVLGTYIIQGTKGMIPAGFDTYIISMDTFGRLVTVTNKIKSSYDYTEMWAAGDAPAQDKVDIWIDPRLREAIGDSPMVIVDECQSFKDPSSNRTKALIGFFKLMNVKHKIFLSATPVKNRADEYFTVLNLLRPDLFPSLADFRRNWLVRDGYKWKQVNPYRLEDFRKMLDEFVLRRETKDVLPDLPPFRREFEVINIDNDKIKKLYNDEVKKLEVKIANGERKWMDVQVNFMALRRLAGIAKIEFAVDYIDTFLETSNEKIAIGVWHTDVRDILYDALQARSFNPLKLSGEDNAQKKLQIVQEFRRPERRVIIINLVAGGVGIDGLEVCNNVIGLERAWNSVDEEQFEGRFGGARQAQSGLPVYAEYWIAKGMIDETMHDMIEGKRAIVHEVTDNNWDIAADTKFLNELINATVGRRV